jgi:hypothetical protein
MAHRPGSRPERWGLARQLRRLPPWALSPPRPLVGCGGRTVSRAPIPSRAFSTRPQS